MGRYTGQLVELSLRGAWVETEVGQQHLLTALGTTHSPLAVNTARGMFAEAIWESFLDPGETWLEDGEDPDLHVRIVASRALGQLGTSMSAAAQAALMVRLVDPDRGVRLAACKALGQLGTAMSAAVQTALVARLEDPNRGQRLNAVKGLSSAQQQGLRLFPYGAGLGRLVSDLSATGPFSDGCFWL